MKYGSAGAERLPAITVRWLVVAALLIALLIGLMQWAKISPMRQIDAFFYDSFIVLGSQPVAEQPVTLVNIDDNSLQEVGQWPWPRYKLAQLLEAIHAGKPAAVGIDVIFPEADRTALAALRQAYRREFGLELALDNIPPVLLDNDVFLGAVMGEAGAIGAIHLLFDQTNVPTIQFQAPRGIQLTGRADALKLEQAQGLLQSVFKVQSQTRFSGFINMKPDFDGKVRRLPLLLRYQDKVYPHLLLAGLMRAHGVETVAVERDSLGWLLKVGPHAIPVAVDGSMLLRFHEPGQPYRSISALELLRSATPPGEIAGKVVYVGTSAAALHDFINTPIDAQFPGLSVYAVGMSNIVGRDHLREPEWGGQASLALSLLCGTVIAVLFVRFSRRRMWLAGSAGLLLVIVLGSGWLVSSAGIYLSPSAGVLSVILCFMWLSVARYAIEKKRAFAWLELVNNTQRVAIESMSAVAETRDPETGGHIKRTQFYVRAIAEKLQRDGKFPGLLTSEYIEWLFLSAPLHDIGKVGVHDHILLKPGKLTDEEFHEMKQHARFGQEIIDATSKSIRGDNFLHVAGEIASYHHEKWDGSGYPYGLAGEDIPLSARLMSVADVYDALISKRCYKPPFSHQTACAIMQEKRGTDFDPVVLDAFFAIETEIIAIAREFDDAHQPDEAASPN